MGRAPCCDDIGLKKGPWTPEEDTKLMDYIEKHGNGSWRALPKLAGLNRCGKSCRLRWSNYLRPDIKRGKFSEEEERLIIHLHSILGNKWSQIATSLPGRTDNEIKNYWNTHLRKKLLHMGIDPVTHRPRTDLNLLASTLPNLLSSANLGNLTSPWDINALRLQADAAQLARLQLLQSLIQAIASNSLPNLDAMNLLGLGSLRNYQFNDLVQFNRRFEGLVNGSLGLTKDHISTTQGFLNSGIPRLPNNFQAYLDSDLSLNNVQEMAAQTNSSCSNELAMYHNNGDSTNQISNSHANIPTANSTPSLVSASPENFNMDQIQDHVNSNDASANSSTSTHFEAWEGLNLDDPDTDLCWKDILDQISWSIPS